MSGPPAAAPPRPGPPTKLYTDGVPELKGTTPRDCALWLHNFTTVWAPLNGYQGVFDGTDTDTTRSRDALRYMYTSIKCSVPMQEALRACANPQRAANMVKSKWLEGETIAEVLDNEIRSVVYTGDIPFAAYCSLFQNMAKPVFAASAHNSS